MVKERNYLFDNIKLLLIFLVVSVHMVAAVDKTNEISSIFKYYMLFACSFHMPLFMFVSGYFSKNVERSREKAYNLFLQYFLVQALFVIFNLTVRGIKPSVLGLISPEFSMWYLICLCFYKLMAKDFVRIKGIIIISSIISVLIMNLSVNDNLRRTLIKSFAFLIFYVLGYFVSDEHIKIIRKIPKIIYAFGFAGCMFCIYGVRKASNLSINNMRMMALRSKTLSELSIGNKGYLIYLFILLIAVLSGLCVIGFMPEKKNLLSVFGKNTMTVYIAQAFTYYLFLEYLKSGLSIHNVRINLVLAFAISVIVVLLFGNNAVADAYGKIINRIQSLIFRNSEENNT